MSDDAFRLAILFALGIMAFSLYMLAASVTLTRLDRIDYERRHA